MDRKLIFFAHYLSPQTQDSVTGIKDFSFYPKEDGKFFLEDKYRRKKYDGIGFQTLKYFLKQINPEIKLEISFGGKITSSLKELVKMIRERQEKDQNYREFIESRIPIYPKQTENESLKELRLASRDPKKEEKLEETLRSIDKKILSIAESPDYDPGEDRKEIDFLYSQMEKIGKLDKRKYSLPSKKGKEIERLEDVRFLLETGGKGEEKEDQNPLNFKPIKRERFEDEYRLFEELWNHSDYGPIIASQILIGTVTKGIPMKALMTAWIRFRQEIKELASVTEEIEEEPFFITLYKRIVSLPSHQCYYQLEQYNFLVDYLELGACNCECGTILAYVLWTMYLQEDYQTFVVDVPAHTYLLILNPNKEWFIFESTENLNGYVPAEKKDLEIEYFTSSTQLVAFSCLFSKEKGHFQVIFPFVAKMFEIPMQKYSFCDEFDRLSSLIDRYPNLVSTPYDNDYFFQFFTKWLYKTEQYTSPVKSDLKKIRKRHHFTEEEMIERRKQFRDFACFSLYGQDVGFMQKNPRRKKEAEYEPIQD